MDFKFLIDDILTLWSNGGILMWPLLLLAIFMYWNIFKLFSIFSKIESDHNQSELLADIKGKDIDQQLIRGHMDLLKKEYLSYFDVRVKFVSVLAGVSPLLGLLGTVMGMLSTFSIMNSGDVKKVDLMAGGISEALITTQLGLIIAVPALLMIVSLKTKQGRLKVFFEKSEIKGVKRVFSEGRGY